MVNLAKLSSYFAARARRGEDGACWLWAGSHSKGGYGSATFRTSPHEKFSVSAYRLSYLLHVGPIPDGLELDHLCQNPGCVNPKHLEAVTHAVNVARSRWTNKTHCVNGHELPPRVGGEHRVCLPCGRAWHNARSRRTGRFKGVGSGAAGRKLTAVQVRTIRQLVANGYAVYPLASAYKMTPSMLYYILRGEQRLLPEEFPDGGTTLRSASP